MFSYFLRDMDGFNMYKLYTKPFYNFYFFFVDYLLWYNFNDGILSYNL